MLIIAILLPLIGRRRDTGHTMRCYSNLRQIGVALSLYAQIYNDKLPSLPITPDTDIVGTYDAQNSALLTNPKWRNIKSNQIEDPHVDGDKTKIPVSACLWLLIRQKFSNDTVFICPAVKSKVMRSDDNYKEDDGSYVSALYFSDFQSIDKPEKIGALICYSFQNPWLSGWTLNNRPGFIIGGDENNGTYPFDNITYTNSNSQNHNKEGQFVLKTDASVAWVTNAWAGLDSDNVYTANTLGSGPTMHPGDKGYLSTRQKDEFDSVLVPVAGTNTGVMSGSKQWTVSRAN